MFLAERARNIKWKQYASPTVRFVVVFTNLCIYSVVVRVSVGVCLPKRGLGGAGSEADGLELDPHSS